MEGVPLNQGASLKEETYKAKIGRINSQYSNITGYKYAVLLDRKAQRDLYRTEWGIGSLGAVIQIVGIALNIFIFSLFNYQDITFVFDALIIFLIVSITIITVGYMFAKDHTTEQFSQRVAHTGAGTAVFIFSAVVPFMLFLLSIALVIRFVP